MTVFVGVTAQNASTALVLGVCGRRGRGTWSGNSKRGSEFTGQDGDLTCLIDAAGFAAEMSRHDGDLPCRPLPGSLLDRVSMIKGTSIWQLSLSMAGAV